MKNWNWKARFLGLGAVCVLLAPFGASAQVAQYGMSGCGLSPLIFDDVEDYEEKWKQIAGSIIDGWVGVKTFAISSGTSNCKHAGGGRASLESDQFLESNRDALVVEMARGEGEHLASLSRLLGCSDKARVGQVLQNNFGSIVDGQGEFKSNVRRVLKSDKVLTGSCSSLS